MMLSDVCYLIHEDPEMHGAFDNDTELDLRLVYCTVRSVGSAEFWRAMNDGHEPTIIVTLADRAEYNGEKLLGWNGMPYRIIRTYSAGQTIELECEEAKAYVGRFNLGVN